MNGNDQDERPATAADEGFAMLLQQAHAALRDFQRRQSDTAKADAQKGKKELALLKSGEVVKLTKAAPDLAAHASRAVSGIQKRLEFGKATSKRIGEELKLLESDLKAAGIAPGTRG